MPIELSRRFFFVEMPRDFYTKKPLRKKNLHQMKIVSSSLIKDSESPRPTAIKLSRQVRSRLLQNIDY